ncbi:MAG TPA: DNA/RNA nuclease SfsA [Methanothrix sp.]|nr:DNA/RNA nuclease SfsA [Methanothrix sp.]
MVARLKIEGEMVRGKFLSRTSRFSVRAELVEGPAETESETEKLNCHLPNPGRLKELLVPGADLLLGPAKRPDRRKTKFDLFAVVIGGGVVVVDSRIPNQLIRVALESGDIQEFAGYELVKSEPSFGNSRLDFLLAGEKLCLVEVKSCTLVRDGVALFPDAPTERGRRHLMELLVACQQGYRTAIVFVIQREDARVFIPNDETDPDFGAALRAAAAGGVEPIALAARYRDGFIELIGEVPVDLSGFK